jgi:hypothetical protein
MDVFDTALETRTKARKHLVRLMKDSGITEERAEEIISTLNGLCIDLAKLPNDHLNGVAYWRLAEARLRRGHSVLPGDPPIEVVSEK